MSDAPAPSADGKPRSQSTSSAPAPPKPKPDTPERSSTTASVPNPDATKPKPRASPDYARALATCLRWDFERNEPYLQLPSFPDLRLTPYRPGIAEDLKTLFNHHEVGRRLYTLPYPMDLAYAQSMETEHIARAAPLLAQLRMSLSAELPEREDAESTPLTAAYGVPPILGYPFKALRSVREDRVVGDLYIGPNTVQGMWAEEGEGKAADDKNGAKGKEEAPKPGEAVKPEEADGKPEAEADPAPSDAETPAEADAPEADPRADPHAALEAAVLALPPAEQSWMLGYVLEPAHSGRGVMGEAVACILEGWVRPFMRIGEVAAIIAADNPGSEKIARRNGLVWRREERTDWPAEKGAGVVVNGYFTRDMRE